MALHGIERYDAVAGVDEAGERAVVGEGDDALRRGDDVARRAGEDAQDVFGTALRRDLQVEIDERAGADRGRLQTGQLAGLKRGLRRRRVGGGASESEIDSLQDHFW